MQRSLEWRVTPRSQQYVAIVPPTTVPGLVTVVQAAHGKLSLRITDQQKQALLQWTESLPDTVLRPTACDTGRLDYNGPYTVIDEAMRAVRDVPRAGETVLVRVTASVRKMGPIYKTVVQVVDVLRTDVAPT
jgi:hypothetical protein